MLRCVFTRTPNASRQMAPRPLVGTAIALTPTASSSPRATPAAAPSSSSSIAQQRRSYVNAIFRKPVKSLMPTQTKEGEPINVDLCLKEIQGLYEALQLSDLVDHVFEMASLPYIDAMFPSDLIASSQDMFIPMPKFGVEHRSKEISDILRYMKSYGSAGDYSHVLQDTPGARANAGDFVNIPTGLLVGYGTNRSTNQISHDAMVNVKVNINQHHSKQAFPVFGIPLADDAPFLGDFLGFAGQRTLFVRDTVHGEQASRVITATQNRIPWQIVKLEPQCDFLTFQGAKAANDVIVSFDDDESIERIGEAGFNAYPIEWSEMRKAGITMRRLCLVARFALGSYSGGMRSANTKARSHKNGPINGSKLFNRGERVFGDTGAPLEAQIRSKEVPQPVYQPPPRYRPPMHRGGLQLYDDARGSGTGEGGSTEDPTYVRSGLGGAKNVEMRKQYEETLSPHPRQNNTTNAHPTMPATRTGVQPPDPIDVRRF